MKHKRDPADNHEAAPRALPVDPATGEVYSFDAGDLGDRTNLLWLIGGTPEAVANLGALLIEEATRANIDSAVEIVGPDTAGWLHEAS